MVDNVDVNVDNVKRTEVEEAKTWYFLWPYCINEMTLNIQNSRWNGALEWCLQEADCWGLSNLLEVMWTMRRDLTARVKGLRLDGCRRTDLYLHGGFLYASGSN